MSPSAVRRRRRMMVQELQREAALSALEVNDDDVNNNDVMEKKNNVNDTLLIDLDDAEIISSNPSSPSNSFRNLNGIRHFENLI